MRITRKERPEPILTSIKDETPNVYSVFCGLPIIVEQYHEFGNFVVHPQQWQIFANDAGGHSTNHAFPEENTVDDLAQVVRSQPEVLEPVFIEPEIQIEPESEELSNFVQDLKNRIYSYVGSTIQLWKMKERKFNANKIL